MRLPYFLFFFPPRPALGWTASLALFVQAASPVPAWGAGAPEAGWPQWRGPKNSGSTQNGGFPTQWTDASVLWKAPLPAKGCSTPIVLEKRIYLTAPSEGKDAVLAFDWTGKPLWKTDLGAEDPGKHRNASGSNPSPVTDGTSIFVTFKSGNLAALDLDGSVRWQANLVGRFGPVNLFWDFGTSPVLTEKNVILARMHNGESWLAAFDKATGEMCWKTDRTYQTPKEGDHGYTTPNVIRYQGREALLTWGAQQLTVHDAQDGKLLWNCGDFNPAATALWPAVASQVLADGMAVVCFGRADRGNPRLHGIRLDGSGDVTSANRVWQREDVGAFVPTPAEYKGLVYILGDRGQVDCIEPRTGKTAWSAALPRSSANFYASPVIADGILYAAREDGAVFVARVEKGFELISENKFDDRIIASIVPVENRLLIRGQSFLYCITTP